MTIALHTTYIHDDQVSLRKGRYGDGSTALVAYSEYGEVLAKLTVCLQDYGLKPRDEQHVFIKNYSENEGVLAGLQTAGVISAPLRTVECGWSEAYECQLLIEVDEL